jgi:xanthine/CO dehydrogenase XdhC/CoxF family maturation factor
MPKNSSEYMKKYYSEKHAENHLCEVCGGHYKLYFKTVHQRSKKHAIAVKRLEEKQPETEERRLRKQNEELTKKLEEALSELNIIKNIMK